MGEGRVGVCDDLVEVASLRLDNGEVRQYPSVTAGGRGGERLGERGLGEVRPSKGYEACAAFLGES